MYKLEKDILEIILFQFLTTKERVPTYLQSKAKEFQTKIRIIQSNVVGPTWSPAAALVSILRMEKHLFILATPFSSVLPSNKTVRIKYLASSFNIHNFPRIFINYFLRRKENQLIFLAITCSRIIF